PICGLTGIIDGTVRAVVAPANKEKGLPRRGAENIDPGTPCYSTELPGTRIVPLELKTGKRHPSAQT
ncbi:unnamed protein product, partial [Chrysoparadoxa australica]